MNTLLNSGQIDIDHIAIRLGQGRDAFEALHDIELHIAPGEFVCLLGPSGCGKSTLLGALAGHLQPSRGEIRVDGEVVREPHPDRGLVFQQHTLFPWQRVVDNVAFGLKMEGVPRAQRRQQAQALLAEVGLQGFEQRYPRELSGGMQQRVEIARVLINRPKVLLMDEPFGALDALTRVKMQRLLLDVWERIRTTVVFITHDIDEALFLGDRIVVMKTPRPVASRQAPQGGQEDSGAALRPLESSRQGGRIVEELTLPFGRPRNAELSTTPEFVALKRHCLHLLHPEGALPRLTPLGETTEAKHWRFAM